MEIKELEKEIKKLKEWKELTEKRFKEDYEKLCRVSKPILEKYGKLSKKNERLKKEVEKILKRLAPK